MQLLDTLYDKVCLVIKLSHDERGAHDLDDRGWSCSLGLGCLQGLAGISLMTLVHLEHPRGRQRERSDRAGRGWPAMRRGEET